ncbi:MAG: MerR family DNA-binding transcriptional regulator [Clostridia bacterium]|nr:MerR family DNA-binding transcriptional regulator [Clostridia bacterium]
MLYTVGEMAKLLNIAPSTLRYYDEGTEKVDYTIYI